MSKMDNLRAMREARYEAARARTEQPPGRSRSASVPERPKAAPRAEPAAFLPDPPVVEPLCGHRNMGGRTCTREAGHAAKSHRYS
jgi:hypothetical protein